MQARVYIRIKQDQRYPFVPAVSAGNNKLKPFYALVNGQPEHHPEGARRPKCSDRAEDHEYLP
jgi:hypothetical protein